MDLDDIVTAIQAGEFDGRLEQIVEAVVTRAREGAVEFPWRITYEGDTWTQQTVTLGELKFAEGHAFVSDARGNRRRATRFEIDPRGTAEHALALIVAHFHKAQGLSLEDAMKRAEAITAADLATMVDEYEVVTPPKDDSPPLKPSYLTT